jgi:XTP/dITP diphosphohydrolase
LLNETFRAETTAVPERKRLLLATNNPGKVREFRRLLAASGFEVVTPGDASISLEVEETGASYAENAALKAKAFAEAGQCLALADDSGIEVDALDGGPGMYSARHGGPGLDDVGRTALLIEELGTVLPPKRSARYRAVVAVAWPDEAEPRLFEGVQEGSIALTPRGERGFGYDPVFLVDGERVQAEISDDEKDLISHRGKAVRAAVAWLAERCP